MKFDRAEWSSSLRPAAEREKMMAFVRVCVACPSLSRLFDVCE